MTNDSKKKADRLQKSCKQAHWIIEKLKSKNAKLIMEAESDKATIEIMEESLFEAQARINELRAENALLRKDAEEVIKDYTDGITEGRLVRVHEKNE